MLQSAGTNRPELMLLPLLGDWDNHQRLKLRPMSLSAWKGSSLGSLFPATGQPADQSSRVRGSAMGKEASCQHRLYLVVHANSKVVRPQSQECGLSRDGNARLAALVHHVRDSQLLQGGAVG